MLRRYVQLKTVLSRNVSLTCFSNKNANNTDSKRTRTLAVGPDFRHFLNKTEHFKNECGVPESEEIPYLHEIGEKFCNRKRKVYFDVHGCQMNVNDTEIVWSILKTNNFAKTDDINDADVVLLMTCAIRESAEAKIWNRIAHIKGIGNKKVKLNGRGQPRLKIGLLGCMAERLKHALLEKEQAIDIIAGPDSYKDLPRLLALTENNQTAVNVLLSLDETYADIMPVRLNEDSVTAFVSIMRGCDNMCTYCIVPFTRGRERSRPVSSIIREISHLSMQGVKEVTLLGQNVNSYRDLSETGKTLTTNLTKGFKTVYKSKIGGLRFADLLDQVAKVDPEMRIRFTSPHPKDFPDEVLNVIKNRPNVCKHLHLPAQSGNNNILERMRRGYTREAYLDLIDHVREVIPGVALCSDFICGFCGETEEEFQDTLTLMERVRYNGSYMFPYSMRAKTAASHRYKDDVPQHIKQQRLQRMIQLYRKMAEELNRAQIGQIQLVLVEGESKRSNFYLAGRNDSNIKVIFPAGEIPNEQGGSQMLKICPGNYVAVQINDASSQVLKAIPLHHSTLQDFSQEPVKTTV